jgi:phosphopantothenoylcysteine decarboxylase/phosphopantothenate--cysteine ligase
VTGAGRLAGRRLVLGITGSIAAYKAVELLRALRAEGADVRVLMTPAATEFVGALTLETLSHHPVDDDVLALGADGSIGHISAAHDVEAIVVAPATARWLAAMALGLAQDTITAACLAADVPVVVAPAMDGGMYSHPATRANVARLREFGYSIVEPETGQLASGRIGQGRLASLDRIVETVVATLAAKLSGSRPSGGRGDLAGRHVIVTAGGTMEAIDPVRFVGNRSSGKMGVAIAAAALDRGARVSLILGSHTAEPPAGAEVTLVESAAEMEVALDAATAAEAAHFDALVMTAAVADFRPRSRSAAKIGRDTEGLRLDLESTPDLLAGTARRVRERTASGSGRAPTPVLVGFAAETGSLARVEEKLRAKGLDLLVANDVLEAGSGFGTETNRVTIYSPDVSPQALPLLPKRGVAEQLLDRIVALLAARDRGAAEGRGAHRARQGARDRGASRAVAARSERKGEIAP